MLRCPVCKQCVSREANPFRPFCSQRCKMVDLDHWLEGRYRIPIALDEDDASEAAATDAERAKVESE